MTGRRTGGVRGVPGVLGDRCVLGNGMGPYGALGHYCHRGALPPAYYYYYREDITSSPRGQCYREDITSLPRGQRYREEHYFTTARNITTARNNDREEHYYREEQ